ncbi:hypothetical protein DO97_09430 [Neosynechococcus sphagnicola sy1]|uniref:Uncharacterized protein n=2 Tax=Neosynechococcus TaxID=1501143 RepID=A0A098TNA0_9CYAN|nr:hypothetical protein DO97_09430 [Neosynechococcus sphagnicola sy1]
MLGTNDVQPVFKATASDIARGCGSLVEIVQRSASGPLDQVPEVLVIAPTPPRGTVWDHALGL